MHGAMLGAMLGASSSLVSMHTHSLCHLPLATHKKKHTELRAARRAPAHVYSMPLLSFGRCR